MGTPPLVPLRVPFTPKHPLQQLGGCTDAHGAGTAKGRGTVGGRAQPASQCATAPFQGKVRTREQFWLVQLEAIYLRRNPYKLYNVPALMARYKGRELLLYRKVCAAYDLNPTKFYADPAAWQKEGNGRGCRKDLVSAEECEFVAEDEVDPTVVEQVADEESADEDSEGMEIDEEAMEEQKEQEEVEASNCSPNKAIGRVAAGGCSLSEVPDVSGAPVASPVRSKEQFWHAQLEAIYRRRNPYKLQSVAAMLDRYRGKEALLYRKVCMMYDLDPAKFHAGVAASTGNEGVAWQREAGKHELHIGPRPLMSPRRHEPAAMVVAASPPTTTIQGSHRSSPMGSPRKASPRSELQLSRLEVHRPVSGPSPAPSAIFQPTSKGCKTPAATRQGCIAQRISTPSINRVERNAGRPARDTGVAPSPVVRWVRQDSLGRPSWKPMARAEAN